MSGKLLVIVGSTGVGKTELSLRLAERWGCGIVNCDSRQIYKDLPIGTAAPTAAEQARVKHYFVGTKGLWENYNAGEYERDAVQVLEQLAKAHHATTPFAILSGGSMLYMDAVCEGLDEIPRTDEKVRQAVREEYEEKGLAWLQQEVERVDEAYWQIVDRQNPQRLLHCLEVSRSSGKAYSSFRRKEGAARPWETYKVGLMRDRETLYARINERVERMVEEGLEEEARRAWEMVGQAKPLPNSLNTVGYKEMIAYIKGDCSREEAIGLIQQNSRHYAKRQMTWYRSKQDIQWLDMNQEIETIVEQIERYIQ